MTRGIGLSVGAANLSAVAVGRAAVRRTAVLTRFTHRPPEVGVPGQNPNLVERGLVITDFVDRVGDPVGLLAPDGTSHRAEVLLADGLRAMFHTVARREPEPVGVSYPAHWRPSAVDALRGALSTMSEFRAPSPVLLTSDAVAALTALQQDPGVPAQGVIVLCDFGGTGTSITLADAASDFAPLAPTERHVDLSGDLIDQALLSHVIGQLSAAGSVDLTGTSAIGSLSRLRAQCRAAKERLSTAAVTALSADLPGHSGEIRLTRTELDDAIRLPLAGFIQELQDVLQRSGIRPSDLVAVASVGGGARMPIVTTTLSENLRVPVITTAHPELAAAIGAGLRAVRGTVVEGATALAPVAPAAPAAAPAPSAAPGPVGGLAWSDAADDDIPDVAPPIEDEPPADGWDSARPQIEFAASEEPEEEPAPWYRSPSVMMAAGLAVVLAAIGVAAVFLVGGDEEPASPTTTTTPTATSSAPPATVSEPPPVSAETSAPAPPSQPANVNTPPPPVTVTEEGPPPPAEPPPAEPPPAEPPPTEAPPPVSEEPPPPSSPPPLIPTLPYETIPGLPFVPAPIQPPRP